jgi:serine/threonine protein phosphatase PrpC
MSLFVEVAGKTDVGCVRQNNEDNFGYDSRYGIYVVCDGMGGQAAGEVASKMAVDTMLGYFRAEVTSDNLSVGGESGKGLSTRAHALGSAIRQANAEIFLAARQPGHSGMGSTIVAVLVQDEFYAIGHAGDSRIYLIRDGTIQQLTEDHSLVMEQVRRGLLTLEEAQKSEMQNIIIRALGPDQRVDADLEDHVASSGDILLLCSDGLTRHVSDEQILDVTKGTNDLQAMADQLIERARSGGGSDNITVLLLRFAKEPWYRRMFGSGSGERSPQWQNSI